MIVLGCKDSIEVSEFLVIASFISDFSEEALSRFHNVSKTTLSKEMVPVQPQSTAHSPRNQPTTVGESQDQTTTVKTPPYKSPDSNNREMEVEYVFSF